jgi:hypothetical protein
MLRCRRQRDEEVSVPAYWPIALVGLVAAALLLWTVTAKRRSDQAQRRIAEQAGFRPCPEQKDWLEETVTRVECNRGFRYEVRDPRRLAGEPAVYYYVKVRHSDRRESVPLAEEEILFPLKRRSADALVLTVKPSSLAHGFATRMIGAVAAGPWDAQPDDLERLDLPRDLTGTNVVAALGPPGANLYDLVDSRTLSVVQTLGDAGALSLQFRDAWCTVSGLGEQVPFRLDQVLASIRSLL